MMYRTSAGHGDIQGEKPVTPAFKADAKPRSIEQAGAIPFVTGVLANLSGGRTDRQSPLASRRFVDIDVNNFDARLAEIQPAVSFYVSNELTNDGTLIDIDLQFRSMADFEPEAVARRIPELAVLLEARDQLRAVIEAARRPAAADDAIQALLRDACGLVASTRSAEPAAHRPHPGSPHAQHRPDGRA